MNRKIVIMLFICVIIFAIVAYLIINKKIHIETKRRKYSYMDIFIAIGLIGVIVAYGIVFTSYDKKGVPRKMESMHYYIENSNEEFVLVDDKYIVNVNNKNKKYYLSQSFVDMKGYLVIKSKKELKLIDKNNFVYIDTNGDKYIEAKYAQWDFFGNPLIR